MAVQLSRAATYLDFYVSPTAGWEFGKIVTFYILLPLIIILLNIAPVKVGITSSSEFSILSIAVDFWLCRIFERYPKALYSRNCHLNVHLCCGRK